MENYYDISSMYSMYNKGSRFSTLIKSLIKLYNKLFNLIFCLI